MRVPPLLPVLALSLFEWTNILAAPEPQRQPFLDPDTVENLSAPFDPAADKLVRTALAKLQAIETLPAFKLTYSLTRPGPEKEKEITFAKLPRRSLEKMLELLQADHDLMEPYHSSEILSLLSDPDNPEEGFRRIAAASKTFNYKEDPPFSSIMSNYWNGLEHWSHLFNEKSKKHRVGRRIGRFAHRPWPLRAIGVIDIMPMGKIPVESERFLKHSDDIPLASARFRFTADEDFCGERCAVLDGTDLPHRLYIDRKTGQLRGLLKSGWQGQMKMPYWKVAAARLGVHPFDSSRALSAWVKTLPKSQQLLVWRDSANYLTNEKKAGVEINLFRILRLSDYVEIADGVGLPGKIEGVSVVPSHDGAKVYDYRYYVYTMTGHSADVTVDDFDRFMPKPGYDVIDERYGIRLRYPYRDDIPQEEIDELLEAARPPNH